MTFRIKRPGKSKPPYGESPAFKIRIRGRDNLSVSVREWREVLLLEVAHVLKEYETEVRIKSADIYLKVVDEDGRPVRINEANELTIYSYRAAADELKL